MTENQTLMSAIRLEVFLTSFSTRMRNDPRIKLWIRDFSTVASVFLGRFRLGVSSPAFGTAPLQILFQILDWKRSGQVDQIIVVKVPLLLKDGVLGPTLNTLQMETAITFGTTPNDVFALQISNANQA